MDDELPEEAIEAAEERLAAHDHAPLDDDRLLDHLRSGHRLDVPDHLSRSTLPATPARSMFPTLGLLVHLRPAIAVLAGNDLDPRPTSTHRLILAQFDAPRLGGAPVDDPDGVVAGV